MNTANNNNLLNIPELGDQELGIVIASLSGLINDKRKEDTSKLYPNELHALGERIVSKLAEEYSVEPIIDILSQVDEGVIAHLAEVYSVSQKDMANIINLIVEAN